MDIAALGIKIDSSQAKAAFADLEKLADAGGDAEKAVNSLGKTASIASKGIGDTGKAAKAASNSIDEYVKKLQLTATTNGMGAREAKLYELAVQGASKAQLQAADAAIRMNDGYERGIAIGEKLKVGLIALGAAAAGAAVALYAGANKLIEQVAGFQQVSEKIGDTAVAVASLKTASDVSGVSIDTVAAASIRLTAALSKTDDESKLVAKGVKALGLNFDDFKKLSPVDQIEAISKAMAGFKDGAEKTAVAVALFGKSGAELVPFLNDLANGSERFTRLTEDQTAAADAHTKSQARLKSQLESIGQTIAVSAIPPIEALTKVMKDAITEALNLDKAASDLGSNSGIASFAEAAGRELAKIADYARTTKGEFTAIGDLLSAYGKSASTLSLAPVDDFKRKYGLNAFFMKTQAGDGEKAGRTFVQAYDDALAAGKRTNFAANDPRRVDLDAKGKAKDDRPTLTPPNTDKTPKGRKDNSEKQEAKAQLAFDLDDIRKAQDALTNTIANGEKLLEAKRSAGLVTEKEYYDQKRTFLVQNEQVQEAALQKEIDRLQQENLSGKDKIDNDRKILDAEAKLAKVRENGAAALDVLATQQVGAANRIKLAIEQATAAAQSYVDTISRQNARDLAGIGKGNQQREQDQRKNQRDDQFQSRRNSLDEQLRAKQITPEEYDQYLSIEQSAHKKALASDEQYWKDKLALQKDWVNGATEALQNYYDESQNVAQQISEAFTSGFKGMEDALTDFVTTGKSNFKDLADSILKDIVRIAIKQSITGPLANALNGAIGGGAGGSGGGLASIFGSAIGAFGGTGAQATVASGMSGDSLENLLKLTSNFSGRAIGGPVHKGGIYEINEKGVGEVFNSGGKQYLMPANDGSVSPGVSGGGARGGDVTNISVTVPGLVDNRARQQIAGDISNQQRNARRFA